MKKFKGVFGIMVMITGMLGTGYAYWMDDLKVYATVATGNFDVEYCEEHTEGDNHGVASLKVDVEDGKAQILIDKLAPGCELTTNLCFKNTGSVNAILSEISIDNAEYTQEYDIVQYRAEIGENIILAENLVIFEEKLENLVDMLKLKKNECKSIKITVFIPYDEEEYQKGQNQNCTFEIVFDWRQDIEQRGSSVATEPAATEPIVIQPPVANEPVATEPTATEPIVIQPPVATEPIVIQPPVVDYNPGGKNSEYPKNIGDGKYSNPVFSGGGMSGGSGGGGLVIKNTNNKFDFKDLKYLIKYLKKQFGIDFIQEISGRTEN